MKAFKTTLLLVAICLVVTFSIPLVANASLFGYYASHGQILPSFHDRVILAAENGIFFYKGTYAQNIALEKILRENEANIGFSVATGFSQTVKLPMSGTQTYINVSSMKLKDGTYLDVSALGGKVFLDIEPGGSKEEIVMCTVNNTTTAQFSNCTRGLSFSGTTTTGNSSIAYTHNAGAQIILSNVHYVYEQFLDLEKDQTVAGAKTFTGTTTFNILPKMNSFNSLCTGNDQFCTKYYIDNAAAYGFNAANVSTTRGLSVDGTAPEKVGVNVSSTTGMSFDASGKLYQKVQSPITISANGIGFNTSSNFIWTGTNTFSGILSISGTTTINNGLTLNGLVSSPSTTIANLPHFVADTSISSKDALIIGSGVSYNSYTQTSDTGHQSANGGEFLAQTFINYNLTSITSVSARVGGGDSNVQTVKICESTGDTVNTSTCFASKDDNFNPLGGVVHTWTFATAAVVTPGTQYAILYYGVNSILWDNAGNAQTGKMLKSTNNGASWSDLGNLDAYATVSGTACASGRVCQANAVADNIYANNFIGYARNSVSVGGIVYVDTFGIVGGFTGLNTGSVYYLSDTPGSVSSTAGTVSRKVGLSVSPLDILIKHDNP